MFRPALLAVLLCAPTQMMATTVELKTGPIYVSDTDDEEVPGAYRFRITKVATNSFITWISGENTTDGVPHAEQTFGPEPKFIMDEFGGIKARDFTGFMDPDSPGPRGSTTYTEGSGRSELELIPDPEGIKPFLEFPTARFKISATGKLGDLPNSGTVEVTADYLAKADANDPMIVTGNELAEAGMSNGSIDLFYTFALYALDLSTAVPGLGAFSTASAAWSVIADGTTTSLLSLSFDAAGGAILSSAAGVTLFLLDALDSPPPPAATNTTDLAAIEALLRADIDPDGRLDTPRFFGALVPAAFNFDATDLGQEAFRMTADSSVTDPASKIGYVPVPPAAAALVFGLAALWAVARPRRPRGRMSAA